MATSAATKVFGIAELLDMILLEYAALEQHLNPFRPVTKLFVFQRVNHTFQDAIFSSEILRRAMFLEHADEEEIHRMKAATFANDPLGRDTSPNHAAVHWLLDLPTSCCEHLDMAGPRKLKRHKPDSLIYKANVFTRGMLCPAASWRNMKMFRDPIFPHSYRRVYIYCSQRWVNPVVWEWYDGNETLSEGTSWIFEMLEYSYAELKMLVSLEDSLILYAIGPKYDEYRYTPEEVRNILAFLEDAQKDVGGGKGKGSEGKAMGSKKKGPSKKRHGRKLGKKQN
ncbi:unnamed protein product [Cercospora beticola]|nr:unnamed protein product [Cercospora beticola]